MREYYLADKIKGIKEHEHVKLKDFLKREDDDQLKRISDSLNDYIETATANFKNELVGYIYYILRRES